MKSNKHSKERFRSRDRIKAKLSQHENTTRTRRWERSLIRIDSAVMNTKREPSEPSIRSEPKIFLGRPRTELGSDYTPADGETSRFWSGSRGSCNQHILIAVPTQ